MLYHVTFCRSVYMQAIKQCLHWRSTNSLQLVHSRRDSDKNMSQNICLRLCKTTATPTFLSGLETFTIRKGMERLETKQIKSIVPLVSVFLRKNSYCDHKGQNPDVRNVTEPSLLGNDKHQSLTATYRHKTNSWDPWTSIKITNRMGAVFPQSATERYTESQWASSSGVPITRTNKQEWYNRLQNDSASFTLRNYS